MHKDAALYYIHCSNNVVNTMPLRFEDICQAYRLLLKQNNAPSAALSKTMARALSVIFMEQNMGSAQGAKPFLYPDNIPDHRPDRQQDKKCPIEPFGLGSELLFAAADIYNSIAQRRPQYKCKLGQRHKVCAECCGEIKSEQRKHCRCISAAGAFQSGQLVHYAWNCGQVKCCYRKRIKQSCRDGCKPYCARFYHSFLHNIHIYKSGGTLSAAGFMYCISCLQPRSLRSVQERFLREGR